VQAARRIGKIEQNYFEKSSFHLFCLMDMKQEKWKRMHVAKKRAYFRQMRLKTA
jgi:hypothetical protein